MIDSSTYLPALEPDAAIFPNISQEWKTEFAVGLSYNFLEPGGSLPEAPTVRAMNVYYSIAITDFYKAVWNGTKTPAEAQTEIVSAANAWVTANNVAS
jgi:arabinogalactan oligomer/maltooligosaccharide transport system substrate-binding protein